MYKKLLFNIYVFFFFSNNGSELIIQMTNLFSAHQCELLSNYNSFQLFQRLLGIFNNNTIIINMF